MPRTLSSGMPDAIENALVTFFFTVVSLWHMIPLFEVNFLEEIFKEDATLYQMPGQENKINNRISQKTRLSFGKVFVGIKVFSVARKSKLFSCFRFLTWSQLEIVINIPSKFVFLNSEL